VDITDDLQGTGMEPTFGRIHIKDVLDVGWKDGDEQMQHEAQQQQSML
jgi:hypothetical protein